MWRSPSAPGTILRFGLAFGAALLTKFSAGLLFFCFAAFILSLRWRPAPEQPRDKAELRAWRRLRLRSLTKGILMAALVVYAALLCHSRGTSQPALPLGLCGTKNMAALLPVRRNAYSATLDLPAGTLAIFHLYRKAGCFYSRALVPRMGSVVLLSSLVLPEVPVRLSPFAGSRAGGWPGCKASSRTHRQIPKGMESHWRAVWVFLVVYSGACILSRFQFQHPPLLCFLGPAGALAGATAAHAGVAARLGLTMSPAPASGSRSRWRWHRLRQQSAPIPTIFHS